MALKPLKTGEGLRGELREGKQRRGGNGLVAPEAQSWAALSGREAVVAWASSGGWRWGTELTVTARLTERRGKGGQLGRREPKGKTYSIIVEWRQSIVFVQGLLNLCLHVGPSILRLRGGGEEVSVQSDCHPVL
jgi:hypothetical protein